MKWILKTRLFARWMKKASLDDEALRIAVGEMSLGLIDADLGGGVFKKRVALSGRGKRGGARTLVATNKGERWIFIFGFEKNDKENVTQTELIFLRRIAQDVLECPESALKTAIDEGELLEVHYGQNH